MSEAAIKNTMEAARLFLNNTEEKRRYVNQEMVRMDEASKEKSIEKAKDRAKAAEEIAKKAVARAEEAEKESSRTFALLQKLFQEGKMDELKAITNNPSLKEEYCKKYGL